MKKAKTSKMMGNRDRTPGNVAYYHSYKYQSLDFLHRIEKMHGIRRVITFCVLTMVLPSVLLIVPLYLRHIVFAEVSFEVTESDIVEITDGISAVFCSEHTLRMNETFNAFQVSKRPEKTSSRKHIRLKKSMTLPDDTLEYWGFYLPKGATVALSVCSKYVGASILVVKGERNLRTCGMLKHNQNKARATGIYLAEAEQQVKVTFESNAQEINSQEATSNKFNEESQQSIHSTGHKPEDVEKNLSTSSQRQSRNLDQNDTTSPVNTLEEDKKLEVYFTQAEKYLNKHLNSIQDGNNSTDGPRTKVKRRIRRFHKLDSEDDRPNSEDVKGSGSHVKSMVHRQEHRKNLGTKENLADQRRERVEQLKHELGLVDGRDVQEKDNHGEEQDLDEIKIRHTRSQKPIKPELLDRGIRHGGNAVKNQTDSDSSVSSFENGLLSCYEGNVLLAHEFDPSSQCNVNYLLLNGNKHLQTVHEVAEDGYYYYIFYSDNDDVKNDIHAVFDIYKPSLQYENVTKACINETECKFSLSMTSVDRVIVEVPTKDGIDHESDDKSVLISTCVPRMGIYVIFPIAVLFLVLGCAFI